MTKKRDLKRRVRERMDKTGERYTTALREVLARESAPKRSLIERAAPTHDKRDGRDRAVVSVQIDPDLGYARPERWIALVQQFARTFTRR